jgi:serine acetyltransferase/acyl carrier protein
MPDTRPLVIVRRNQSAKFALLAQALADEPNVRLIWDRRSRERRREGASSNQEDRRRRDRRSDPSKTWGHNHCLLMGVAESVESSTAQTRAIAAPNTDEYARVSEEVGLDIDVGVRSDLTVLTSGGDAPRETSLAYRTHRWDCVKADIRRVTYGEATTTRRLGTVLFNPGLHAVLLYRVRKWLYLHHLEPIAIVVDYVSTILTGAQISGRARIGKGLAICHPQGIVIGATVVMGEYCTLVQGNVIGQLYGQADRPTIGDHLLAGAGAKILGRIQIGNHVQVGANAVVTRSLPDGAVIVAVPSRVVPGTGTMAPREFRRANGQASAPSREAIRQRVNPILAAFAQGDAPTDGIPEETALLSGGVGLSSIEFLRLICAIEKEFGITIDEGEAGVSQLETVGSLVTFIRERMSQ